MKEKKIGSLFVLRASTAEVVETYKNYLFFHFFRRFFLFRFLYKKKLKEDEKEN